MTSRKHTPRAATARLDALTLGGEFPPKRIRMFAAGENHTTKGMFLFDAEAARAVMDEFQRCGVDLPMDFDHGSLEAPDGRKRDVPGYYVPEVVDGELWAVPQWTDVGLAAIRPGESGTLPEYRYVSPTFTYDRESRRVLSLGPLALTPYPATHNARPLVLARDRRGAAQVAHLAMSFDDIREAIARALTAVHGWGVEIEDVYADAVVYEVRGPDGSERCFRATYSISSAAGDVVIGEAVEVEEQYVPVEGGARFVFSPSPAPMVGASQPAQPAQESPPMTAPSAVLVALAATDEAAGLTALAALRTDNANLKTHAEALVAATGAKTHAEALGAVEAWKRDAAELSSLRAKVQADEAARAKAARDAELDACVREGKLTPAEREQDGKPSSWLSALSTAEAVAAFRAARHPVVSVSQERAHEEPAKPAALAVDVDDATINSLARQASVDPAAIRAALTAQSA